MISDDFYKALAFILKWEGGYSNNPNDPGGETKFGISKRAYPNLDIRNLTESDAENIYIRDYWYKIEEIPGPLCICVMDTAVNIGMTKALALLTTSADWKDYLIQRVVYYNNLNQKDFIHGWINRVIDLYATVKMEEHPLNARYEGSDV